MTAVAWLSWAYPLVLVGIVGWIVVACAVELVDRRRRGLSSPLTGRMPKGRRRHG